MWADRLGKASELMFALSKIFGANTPKEVAVLQGSQVKAQCCLHINFSLHFIPPFLFRIILGKCFYGLLSIVCDA